MSIDKSFYITTTLPYVNAKPHLGHALEFVRADAVARYKKLCGYRVFLNTGTDEHGQKVWQKAHEAGEDVQEYADRHATHFQDVLSMLGMMDDVHFIRTTDKHHVEAAQEFWRRCDQAGYIYKKQYQVKYCVGCELEKTDSDLEKERCPVHPDKELELIDEENYFFKFSAFQQQLLDFYDTHPNFVVPAFRQKEIRGFVEDGLRDFSISRVQEKMPWGVEVPGDPTQVMYVWFDALVNYISTLGWPNTDEEFTEYWTSGTPTQYCGKDNLRQQTAMWQAMLMAAGISNSHQVVVNGFINIDGQKMSKSSGNVIDPAELVEEYGTDALRYYLLRHVHPFEDSDMTMEKFAEVYNANLANGIGNVTSRIMKMVVMYDVDLSGLDFKQTDALSFHGEHMDKFELQTAMDEIWRLIGDLDQFIAENEPYKVVKENPETAHKDVRYCAEELARIAVSLLPFMPETADSILELVREKKTPHEPLFVRKK